MSTLSWMSRVRAFFGAKPHAAPALATESAWSGAGGEAAMVGAAIADGTPTTETAAPAQAEARRSPGPAPAPPTEPAPPPEPPPAPGTQEAPSRIDPLDPPWVQHLESLGAVGRQLQTHRETGEALLRTVRQLPDLTSDQTDHIVRTNRLLERQNTLLASMLDTMSNLRASMQTMEESSRRHLTAIGGLEVSHWQVLLGYQKLLMKSHRRLGRLAALATVLAAVALGGVAWVLYLVLAAG